MTLATFKGKFYSRPTIAPPTMLYVFETEESADAWIMCKYFGSDDHAYTLPLVIQSDMCLEYTLKDEWCSAQVLHFYAVEPDVIVVIVEKED